MCACVSLLCNTDSDMKVLSAENLYLSKVLTLWP